MTNIVGRLARPGSHLEKAAPRLRSTGAMRTPFRTPPRALARDTPRGPWVLTQLSTHLLQPGARDMGPALRTIVSATLRSVAFIAFVVVLILVLLPAALVEAGR